MGCNSPKSLGASVGRDLDLVGVFFKDDELQGLVPDTRWSILVDSLDIFQPSEILISFQLRSRFEAASERDRASLSLHRCAISAESHHQLCLVGSTQRLRFDTNSRAGVSDGDCFDDELASAEERKRLFLVRGIDSHRSDLIGEGHEADFPLFITREELVAREDLVPTRISLDRRAFVRHEHALLDVWVLARENDESESFLALGFDQILDGVDAAADCDRSGRSILATPEGEGKEDGEKRR